MAHYDDIIKAYTEEHQWKRSRSAVAGILVPVEHVFVFEKLFRRLIGDSLNDPRISFDDRFVEGDTSFTAIAEANGIYLNGSNVVSFAVRASMGDGTYVRAPIRLHERFGVKPASVASPPESGLGAYLAQIAETLETYMPSTWLYSTLWIADDAHDSVIEIGQEVGTSHRSYTEDHTANVIRFVNSVAQRLMREARSKVWSNV